MTSLLGRLLRLFPESVPLEDLFTEAVARLFEARPRLCLDWLEEVGLLTRAGQEYIRVTSQRKFVALEHHDTDSRPDLMIEVYRSSAEETVEDGAVADVVMIESKIGSREGLEQLRRYAEHLEGMTDFSSKVLVYITRGHDPKDSGEILSDLSGDISFKQLRWHDFYRFLQTVEKDALVEEVMAFMEEQGMARSYRFTTTDLIALSGLPKAFDIFDETLGGEVRAELESFAGNKIRREMQGINNIRWHRRYLVVVPLHRWDLYCYVGYQLGKVEGEPSIVRIPDDSYPAAFVMLEAQPDAVGREASVAAMEKIALRKDWEAYNTHNPADWVGVSRSRSLTNFLQEEDHIAAVKRFFIREDLTAFKKEHSDLPWAGG